MADLRTALKRVYANGDPWYRHYDHCTACEGLGRIRVLIAFIHHHDGDEWVECWDCKGTGKPAPGAERWIWKDISRDD